MNAEQLIEAERAISVPFRLVVQGTPGRVELVFREVLRLLPGKRIVAVAEHEGQKLLVKTFLGRSAARYAAREQSGVEAIAAAGVRTPKLLWSGEVLGGHGRMLAFEYLEHATDLDAMWETAGNEDDELDILTRAVIVIARLHCAGVVQTDIHLNNFILSEGRLFTIDGGGIDAADDLSPLSETGSLNNLGLFFAQFHKRVDVLARVVLPAYEAVREWERDDARLGRLLDAIATQRRRRKKDYIDKAFRECTRFVCESTWRSFAVCERVRHTDGMRDLLESPDAYIARGQILKDGNSSTVALVEVDGQQVVVKRYNLKGVWHAFRRAMRKSRAWNCWLNAYRLEFLGIPALRPIAMIERRWGPLRMEAYFVTEYVPGPDIQAFLRDNDVNGEIEAIVKILSELRLERISHGDLKATNFIVSSSGPVIIDLDGMREHGSDVTFSRAFDQDIDRFLKNWTDAPDIHAQVGNLMQQSGLRE